MWSHTILWSSYSGATRLVRGAPAWQASSQGIAAAPEGGGGAASSGPAGYYGQREKLRRRGRGFAALLGKDYAMTGSVFDRETVPCRVNIDTLEIQML
jgi:hypothetical protein